MFRRAKWLRETEVKSDCEVCGRFFDIIKGGVCEKCRRILCPEHLHGSWTQRVIADVTGHAVCVTCRRG